MTRFNSKIYQLTIQQILNARGIFSNQNINPTPAQTTSYNVGKGDFKEEQVAILEFLKNFEIYGVWVSNKTIAQYIAASFGYVVPELKSGMVFEKPQNIMHSLERRITGPVARSHGFNAHDLVAAYTQVTMTPVKDAKKVNPADNLEIMQLYEDIVTHRQF
jgi:hypothetical protein